MEYIANFCDCTSINENGDDYTLKIFKKYPYSECYANRSSSKNKNKPATYVIKSSKDKPFVINMFIKLFQGKSFYPNDSIEHRNKYLNECLKQIIENINNIKSIAFPKTPEQNFEIIIEDFKNKYNLKYNTNIKVFDHDGKDYFNENIILYDNPKHIINIGKVNILAIVKLDNLVIFTENDKLKKEENIIEITKIEPEPEHESICEPESEIKSEYPWINLNPSWTKKISKLALTTINKSWKPIFKTKTISNILKDINKNITDDLNEYGNESIFLPQDQTNIFRAFNLCQFPPKVVILGQDPYFANVNEPCGLAFSVNIGIKKPSSLINILKEVKDEGFSEHVHGDLSNWCEQGVLLLNTALTVRHKTKCAHLAIWKQFTNEILKQITEKSNNIIFLLWGNVAQSYASCINGNDKGHIILKSAHPSGLSAHSGFFGNGHFKQTNELLKKMEGSKEIKW